MQKSIYPWQKNRNRGKMLRGVVSTSVMKDPVLTKTEKQQAYVKESLTRAMQEVRMAKMNGQKLPDARDLLKVKRVPIGFTPTGTFCLLFLMPFKAYSWSHPRWWQSQSRLISQSE